MTKLNTKMLIENIDLKDMEETSSRFVSIFKQFVEISEGDKLRIVNVSNVKIIEIDDSYFQSVIRWIYNQGRNQTYDYLIIVIEEYFNFLQMLEDIYKNDKKDKNNDNENRKNVLEIIDLHNEFSKKIINSIKILNETYKKYNFDGFDELYTKYVKMIN